MASSNSFLRLTLLVIAMAAAVGAVSTPAVHGQPLVLLAPQAADADYIHQVDSISTTVLAATTYGHSSAASDEVLIGEESALDKLWTTGRVPTEFVTSHIALRTVLDLLVTIDEKHAPEGLDAEYGQAVSEFTRNYQRALHALGLPPAPSG